MRYYVRHYWPILILVFLTSCAGINRSCSSCWASAAGADWVVVKNDLNGKPFRCWTLSNVSITSEQNSDGVYWKSSNGHLVHVAGNYDYVQVQGKVQWGAGGDAWGSAYAELGLTEETCKLLRERQFTKEQLGLAVPAQGADCSGGSCVPPLPPLARVMTEGQVRALFRESNLRPPRPIPLPLPLPEK